MDEPSHLRLARANDAFARMLAMAEDESSLRWSVVVAFYAAHHYAHALFARLPDQLPPDQMVQTPRGEVRLSFVHPSHHGRSRGGTRFSVARVIERRPNLGPLADLFLDMLDQSHAARYGLDGILDTRFSRADAEQAIQRLQQVVSIMSDP